MPICSVHTIKFEMIRWHRAINQGHINFPASARKTSCSNLIKLIRDKKGRHWKIYFLVLISWAISWQLSQDFHLLGNAVDILRFVLEQEQSWILGRRRQWLITYEEAATSWCRSSEANHGKRPDAQYFHPLLVLPLP